MTRLNLFPQAGSPVGPLSPSNPCLTFVFSECKLVLPVQLDLHAPGVLSCDRLSEVRDGRQHRVAVAEITRISKKLCRLLQGEQARFFLARRIRLFDPGIFFRLQRPSMNSSYSMSTLPSLQQRMAKRARSRSRPSPSSTAQAAAVRLSRSPHPLCCKAFTSFALSMTGTRRRGRCLCRPPRRSSR